MQEEFLIYFKGSVIQVWDIAGQSYEMAHAKIIVRGSILVFVTKVERMASEQTRVRITLLLDAAGAHSGAGCFCCGREWTGKRLVVDQR